MIPLTLHTVAKPSPSFRIGLVTLLFAIFGSSIGGHNAPKCAALAALPRLTIWAWENPEDLRALDPQRYAVAYLDQTIFISSRVWSHPRLQPLLLSPATRIIAVVRIEAGEASTAINAPGLPTQVASLIQRSAQKPRNAMLQIDFDATRSQRTFYASLLREVKKRVPAGLPLSITALASWCADDDWISGLPVDEAVPMFFRMGPDHPLTDRPGWIYPVHELLCQGSAGVSTDEPWPSLGPNQRIYVFHPGAWTPTALTNLETSVTP
jgi:hypothetical protein